MPDTVPRFEGKIWYLNPLYNYHEYAHDRCDREMISIGWLTDIETLERQGVNI